MTTLLNEYRTVYREARALKSDTRSAYRTLKSVRAGQKMDLDYSEDRCFQTELIRRRFEQIRDLYLRAERHLDNLRHEIRTASQGVHQ